MQAIPLIAKEASDLTVFQRTANYVIPARNGPVPATFTEPASRTTPGSASASRTRRSGSNSRCSRRARWSRPTRRCTRSSSPRWDEGGFGIWLGSYVDIFYNDEANAKVRNFLHDRIREKVNDPETAELLIPKGYPFGVKRNPPVHVP